ncbi:hypothetical protein FRX31_008184 [Thalictrum thalictroides]|uniref:Uncharacterized protein n=1 Tax=Thalictrum thalictroides TaxID=46969 RepID=A0A7J6X0H0_THATH|nr:hypothetical protein FRX31_008184 [Thalictrum thalictroides]
MATTSMIMELGNMLTNVDSGFSLLCQSNLDIFYYATKDCFWLPSFQMEICQPEGAFIFNEVDNGVINKTFPLCCTSSEIVASTILYRRWECCGYQKIKKKDGNAVVIHIIPKF